MRVEWTTESVVELDNMLAHIAREDANAAALVAERVLHAESIVARFPKSGRHDAETDTFDRYIPKTRIVLTYAIRDDSIWIITVWHTSRDPHTKPEQRA